MWKNALLDKTNNENLKICEKIIKTAKEICNLGYGDIKFTSGYNEDPEKRENDKKGAKR